MKKTLHLNLKRKWFDLIKSGEKKEEYRERKEYWNIRLGMSDLIEYPELYEFDSVTFSNGYAKNRDQFKIELKEISIGEGNPDWGAIPGKKYFVLELGEVL